MPRPPYDSSRWTGELGQPPDGSRWTAEVGEQFVPPHLRRAKARPVYGANQLRATQHATLLMLSPILIWLAGVVVGPHSVDLLVEAPPLTGLCPWPLLAGVALWLVVAKGFAPNLCRWLGLVGWIVVVMAALVYAVTGVYARAHAVPGPEMRSQVAKIEIRGRRYFKTRITTLALQDGTFAEAEAYPAHEYGSMGRCLAVRRLTGPFGFVWLRITEAAPLPPAPGPGQLAWPVEPVSPGECFSHKPLSKLRATT
jgi:hypothetical protein